MLLLLLSTTNSFYDANTITLENNIVLLPDTLLTLPKDVSLAQTVQHHLDKYEFAFLFKPETDKQMLMTKGCVQLDENMRVLAYEDKPSDNIFKFNGYWCSFAFKKGAFDECIAFMEQSTLNVEKSTVQIRDTPIFKSKAIQVEDYKDLGTWEEIAKILAQS